jgi:hypothetical protein
MVVLALVVTTIAVLALFVTARRARDAAQQAILTVSASRRELRPALVLARDDARRAAMIRPPDRR